MKSLVLVVWWIGCAVTQALVVMTSGIQQYGKVIHVTNAQDYLTATRDDCFILFYLDNCETCKTLGAIYNDLASNTAHLKFCAADVTHSHIQRIADILEIDRVPFLVYYDGEDVTTMPCTLRPNTFLA